MWDYHNMPLNIDDIICLPFSFIWIFLSIIAIFIADSINYYVFDETPVPYYKLSNKIILKYKKNHIKNKKIKGLSLRESFKISILIIQL